MAARKTRPLSKKHGKKKGGSVAARKKSPRASTERHRARPVKRTVKVAPKAKAKRPLKTAPKPKRAPAAKAKRPLKAAPKAKRPLKAAPKAKRPVKAAPKRMVAVKAPKRAAAARPKIPTPRAAETKAKPAARARSAPPEAKTAVAPAKHGLARPAGPARRPDAVREPQQRSLALPLPMAPPPKRPSLEERAASVDTRAAAMTSDFRRRYIDSFDMSWIYHDSALEGVVYTTEELRAALSGHAQPVTDSGLQPTYDDIRRHKEAIDFVRDFAAKKRLPVTVDVIKKIYLILHPEEADIKAVKYRRDIPQHRLYFHEYALPDKIPHKVRQVVDWLNDPETRKTRSGVRLAARAHYDLLRIYPFPTDSGKVARLFMNLILLRAGLPPSILHSTERQRYYEALKGSASTILQMVQESVENALASVEKLLDEHESRSHDVGS